LTGHVGIVDTVEEIKMGQGLPDFVCLEMTDEMPPNGRRQEGNFCESLLNPALAENQLTQVEYLTNGFEGVRLGNGNELDGLRIASRPLRCGGNAGSDGLEFDFGLTHEKKLFWIQ
jgi:hypothetical protein